MSLDDELPESQKQAILDALSSLTSSPSHPQAATPTSPSHPATSPSHMQPLPLSPSHQQPLFTDLQSPHSNRAVHPPFNVIPSTGIYSPTTLNNTIYSPTHPHNSSATTSISSRRPITSPPPYSQISPTSSRSPLPPSTPSQGYVGGKHDVESPVHPEQPRPEIPYRHPPPVARVQPVNRAEISESTNANNRSPQHQSLAHQLKALLAERDINNRDSRQHNSGAIPPSSSLLEEVRQAVHEADISLGKKPVISSPVHVSSTAHVVSTGQLLRSSAASYYSQVKNKLFLKIKNKLIKKHLNSSSKKFNLISNFYVG